MSKKYPGGIIKGTPVVPTATSAPGIWTVCQAQNYTKAGIWPRSPDAPTIGTATQASATSVSVTFSAPSCTGSASITGYTVTSAPGCLTATGASSPLTVSGLTTGTAYTFKAKATNGAGTGPCSAASNSVTPLAVGQQAYTSQGTYTWVAPTGVTSVSVVAVGGGAGGLNNQYDAPCAPGYYNGGGGGGLGWKNNISVTPGNSYTVVVGRGGPRAQCEGLASRANGGCSYFINTSTVAGIGGSGDGTGGSYVGTGGGVGGSSVYNGATNGAGGAGGYSGNGGAAGIASSTTGKAGSGGAGGGGGYGTGCGVGGTGGGVGILGQGTSGASVAAATNGNPGSGGSGTTYGGGGTRGTATGGVGAVRIIWPGTTRSFPSTCTGNL